MHIAMADNNNNNRSNSNNNGGGDGRGFASMDPEKQREIASMGGKSQGKENNPGNFANDREKASRAGREGGSQ